MLDARNSAQQTQTGWPPSYAACMPPQSLEETLDQLYAADPDEFVALRKQLQGELRSAGQKPEAALLGRARRPSTSMWAVNQLVRRRPELVDALLERSDALR